MAEKRSRRSSSSGSSRSSRRSSSSSGKRRARRSRQTDSTDSGSFQEDFKSRLTPTGKRRMTRQERLAVRLVFLVCALISLTAYGVWKSKNATDLEWDDATRLPEVRPAPACVSSELAEGTEQYIAPLHCRGSAEYVLEKLAEILRQQRNYRHVRESEDQVQAVAVTPWLGFEDDIIFQVRHEPERLAVYASARVGVTDFGANRRRVEELRKTLRELQLVK